MVPVTAALIFSPQSYHAKLILTLLELSFLLSTFTSALLVAVAHLCAQLMVDPWKHVSFLHIPPFGVLSTMNYCHIELLSWLFELQTSGHITHMDAHNCQDGKSI